MRRFIALILSLLAVCFLSDVYWIARLVFSLSLFSLFVVYLLKESFFEGGVSRKVRGFSWQKSRKVYFVFAIRSFSVILSFFVCAFLIFPTFRDVIFLIKGGRLIPIQGVVQKRSAQVGGYWFLRQSIVLDDGVSRSYYFTLKPRVSDGDIVEALSLPYSKMIVFMQ